MRCYMLPRSCGTLLPTAAATPPLPKTLLLPHCFAPPRLLRVRSTLIEAMRRHTAATLLPSPPILQQSNTKQTMKQTTKPYPTCACISSRHRLASPPPQPPPPSPSPPQPHPSPGRLHHQHVHRPVTAKYAIAGHRFHFANRHASYPTACHNLRHHPSPQGESGTTPLYGGGGHDVQHQPHQQKKRSNLAKPPNPPPSGKRGSRCGFEGGLVSVHHCRLCQLICGTVEVMIT